MKYFKYISFFLVLSLSGLGIETAQAQYYSKTLPNLPNFDKAKYNFGFYVGANQMMFTIKGNPGFQYTYYKENQITDIAADSARLLKMNSKPAPGFSVGLVSTLRMGKFFELRFTPGLQFGERSILYTIEAVQNHKPVISEVTKRVVSTYIDIPFHLRFKAMRIHNLRPYIYAGPKFKWDLSSQKKKEDNPRDVRLKMEKTDIAIDVGVGFDIYTNWFKFGMQVEMSYGLKDILIKQNNIYTDPVSELRSKIFQVVFTFE